MGLFRLMVRGEDAREFPVGVTGDTPARIQSNIEDWVWWLQMAEAVRGNELISTGGDVYAWEVSPGRLVANGRMTGAQIVATARELTGGKTLEWGRLVLTVVDE